LNNFEVVQGSVTKLLKELSKYFCRQFFIFLFSLFSFFLSFFLFILEKAETFQCLSEAGLTLINFMYRRFRLKCTLFETLHFISVLHSMFIEIFNVETY